MSHKQDLAKIEKALLTAKEMLQKFTLGSLTVQRKGGGDPVTEADHAVDEALRKLLLQDNEGWLSEETFDDMGRLGRQRVWIVDPLDGTREFIEGIPEWCVSIALVEDGRPIAGGICVPATEQIYLGSRKSGVTLNGRPVQTSNRESLQGARVLASRSEVNRGEWQWFADQPFTIIPTGSVAHKLALVAAGEADATFSLVPKNEWDIAAGVFLVEAAGGKVTTLDNEQFLFNQKHTLVNGVAAANPTLWEQIHKLITQPMQPQQRAKPPL